MLTKSVLFSALAALSAASPISERLLGPRQLPGPGCAASQPFNPTLPVTGGDHELPEPDADWSLKRIVLGVGIQNYSCEAAGADPVAKGALAMLYDITPLTPGAGHNALSEEDFTGLSAKALNSLAEVPLNFDPSIGNRVPGAHDGASATEPFTPNAPLHIDGMRPLPFNGHHFFNTEGVPVFRLDDDKLQLNCVKADTATAPPDADAGPDGTGAVAWLQLTAADGSVGLKAVYRLLTAGGNSHGCQAAGDDTTTYAATYWFYN